MSDYEKRQALIKYRLEQADDALRAAQGLIALGLHRDSVNRTYYAIFYSILALLVTRSLGASQHSSVLTLFSREFVRTGLFPRDMARLASRAFERRLDADYAELIEVSEESAAQLLRDATEF